MPGIFDSIEWHKKKSEELGFVREQMKILLLEIIFFIQNYLS